MEFIKRNKTTIFIIVIFLILVFFAAKLKSAFFPDERTAIYGNRLEGIEEVTISKSTFDKVKENFKEDGVSKITTRVSGRTVEIIITVNSEVSLDVAKSYGNKSLEAFSDKEKKYYDFQIFIKKDSESAEFPIIGYKPKSKEHISWTKDRSGSE